MAKPKIGILKISHIDSDCLACHNYCLEVLHENKKNILLNEGKNQCS